MLLLILYLIVTAIKVFFDVYIEAILVKKFTSEQTIILDNIIRVQYKKIESKY